MEISEQIRCPSAVIQLHPLLEATKTGADLKMIFVVFCQKVEDVLKIQLFRGFGEVDLNIDSPFFRFKVVKKTSF